LSRTLIKNGVIISMDTRVGDLPKGDVLIEDDKIADVGPSLDVDAAAVIDAAGMIVMPGLINAHIHLWQTALRGLGSDWAGSDYYNFLHANLAPRYRPEDTFIGTLMGALNQLNCGTTTVFDWCHNNTTPTHTDAAVDGLEESGVRALFGHGTVKPKPKEGEPHFSTVPHPESEIRRLRDERFASNGNLMTLAMAILGPDYATLEVNLHDFRLARELDLLSSAHVWGRDNRLVAGGYRTIAAEGLLGPDHNISHGNYMEDDEIQVICDSGASMTSTPPMEIRGHVRESVIGRVIAAGGHPSIGVDSEVAVPGDMFNAMRTSLQVQRIFDNLAHAERIRQGQDEAAAKFAKENLKVIGTGGSMVKELSVKTRQALEWATIDNARALRLEDKIGSLTIGKQADILLLRADTLNVLPVNDPIQCIVFNANQANVDTVFVAGKKMKEGGKMILDAGAFARRKRELIDSGQWLLEQAGLL
jgi:5-methylthioadenosine/S-adenosylhomocysteine deaminase